MVRGKKLLPLGEVLIAATIVIGVIIACVIIVYAMIKKGVDVEKPKMKENKLEENRLEGFPFKIEKTVSPEEAQKAREELRILDLEREILSDAVRKLYEAHAEGKITEEERERLAQAYKDRMRAVKESISKDEALITLYELEAMQEDLMRLFSERFDEISSKIEDLRAKLEVKSIREVAIPTAAKLAPPVEEEEEITGEGKKEGKPLKKRRKVPVKPSTMTEAEKRIEEIRAEVEKVLERLGQMEIET